VPVQYEALPNVQQGALQALVESIVFCAFSCGSLLPAIFVKNNDICKSFLGTIAQMERENIKIRLDSGCKLYKQGYRVSSLIRHKKSPATLWVTGD
jgi:hypothetical protein